ncbi:MAG TPA: radical SAM protein [Candidatus Wallbacteria bacterium]|nr:radical SAM protein [Candidatus Wallbacteria bacterium]
MKVLFLDPLHKVWEFFRGLTASPALIYLAAVARREFDVRVFDASMESKDPWNRTAEYLLRERPDVVCITGSITGFWNDSQNAAKLVRETLPETRIITGGYIASRLWNEALQSGFFDFVVIDEGELTFLELLSALNSNSSADYSKIRGLAYLEKGVPRKNVDREFIADLDTLPLPAYDMFPMDRYSLAPFGGHIGFALSFNRGCQNKCKFCSETLQWKHMWRGHGAEYMVEVLELLNKKYNKKVFYVGDDDFLHDRERTIKFIELMDKKKLDIKMWIQTTCYSAIANVDLLAGLKRIGVHQFMMGIETPKPLGMKNLNKPQNIDIVMKALETVKPFGFIMMGMLMWGAPWDKKEDLDYALDFLGKHCDIIGPNATTPWPGTPYYDECEKMGAIEVRDLTKYDMTNVITRTAELSAAEADFYYKKTVGKFLMLNKKFLGNYMFSKKPLYREYINMFVKMGWRFFIMKPWYQKNYQPFEEFYYDFIAKKASVKMTAQLVK